MLSTTARLLLFGGHSSKGNLTLTRLFSAGDIRVFDQSQHLYSTPVQLPGGKEGTFTIDAVFQDTAPSGSSKGTVVSMHGSPGSHKDFKFITPSLVEAGFRVVGINFPGFALSGDSDYLAHHNEERTLFAQTVIDRLGLSERVLFLAHSRGCENALRLTVTNQDKSIGMAVVAPTGFEEHKAIRPVSRVKKIRYYYDRYPFARGPMEKVLYHVYHRVLKLRVRHGRTAVSALTSMSLCDLEKQKPFIDLFNKNPDLFALILYAGKDHLIETEISAQFADAIEGRKHLQLRKKDDEEAVTEEVAKTFLSGTRRVTMECTDDHHFIQAKRAKLISGAIQAMFQAAEQSAKKG